MIWIIKYNKTKTLPFTRVEQNYNASNRVYCPHYYFKMAPTNLLCIWDPYSGRTVSPVSEKHNICIHIWSCIGHWEIFNAWSKLRFPNQSGMGARFGRSHIVSDFREVICCKLSCKTSILWITNSSRQVRYWKLSDRLNFWYFTILNLLRECSPCNTSFVNDLRFSHSVIYISWTALRLMISVGKLSSVESL